MSVFLEFSKKINDPILIIFAQEERKMPLLLMKKQVYRKIESTISTWIYMFSAEK